MKNNYKIKMICLLCVFTALFSNCKKSEINEEKGLTNNKGNLASASDGLWDLLGYGYDVTGEYANSSASKYSVIDVVRLKADHNDRVEEDKAGRKYGEVIGGENAATYLSNLTNKVGANAAIPEGDIPKTTPSDGKNLPIPLFKISITNSFDNTDAWASKYVYSSYSLKIQQKRVKINAETELLKQYLQPAFIYDVQNSSPQQIVAKFGTHVLKDIILGAKLSVKYRAETNSTDRKTAATSGIDINVLGIFGLNTSQTTTTQQTTNNTNWKLVFETIGGEPSASLSGSATAGSAPSISTVAWENSSNINNAELIDFAENGLIPIWELIPDASKAQAVKDYTIQYLNNNQVRLSPTTLYEYYNQVTNRHAYSLRANQDQYWPNYYHNAEPFKVFTTEYAGAIPLYQFYNPSIDNRVLTTNRYPGFGGYNYDGIICYVYQSQVSGTVPIYEFYSSAGGHFYTANRNASFPGWSYNGRAFYAFQN